MACYYRNLILNGGFEQGLKYWTGTNIKLTKSPVKDTPNAVLMPATKRTSLLRQKVNITPTANCAYYLYFRILNVTPKNAKPAKIVADIDYYDAKGRNLHSMPLLVYPQPLRGLKWSGYFAIVPPAKKEVKYLTVTFKLSSGIVYLDYISLVPHAIDPRSIPAKKNVKQLH